MNCEDEVAGVFLENVVTHRDPKFIGTFLRELMTRRSMANNIVNTYNPQACHQTKHSN